MAWHVALVRGAAQDLNRPEGQRRIELVSSLTCRSVLQQTSEAECSCVQRTHVAKQQKIDQVWLQLQIRPWRSDAEFWLALLRPAVAEIRSRGNPEATG